MSNAALLRHSVDEYCSTDCTYIRYELYGLLLESLERLMHSDKIYAHCRAAAARSQAVTTSMQEQIVIVLVHSSTRGVSEL